MVAPGGACMVAPGEGGMRGCSGGVHDCSGACVVAPGGHVWLLWRGVCGCSQGGMHGCSGGWGCVVAPRGWEGMCGCSRGGACMVALGGMCGCSWGAMRGFFQGEGMHSFSGGACIGYDEIQSMSRQYASYWNAFLFYMFLTFFGRCIIVSQKLLHSSMGAGRVIT